jgi:hypothetical protein
MDFFRGILSVLVFTAFLVLLFVAGFLMGKAYGQVTSSGYIHSSGMAVCSSA